MQTFRVGDIQCISFSFFMSSFLRLSGFKCYLVSSSFLGSRNLSSLVKKSEGCFVVGLEYRLCAVCFNLYKYYFVDGIV